MACMCGDICCPSCGPAQGNWRCPICRAWASEGCNHIGEDGTIEPEFEDEARRLAEEEALAEEALARDLEEADRLAEEYWNNQTLEDNGHTDWRDR